MRLRWRIAAATLLPLAMSGCGPDAATSPRSSLAQPARACAGELPPPARGRTLPTMYVAREVPPEERIARMWFVGGVDEAGSTPDPGSGTGYIAVYPSTLELEPVTVLRLLSHELAHWQFHRLPAEEQVRLTREMFRAYGEETLLSFLHSIDRPDESVFRHNYELLLRERGRKEARRYVADEIVAWLIAFADVPFAGERKRELREAARWLARRGSMDLSDFSDDERKYVLLLAHRIEPCGVVRMLAHEFGFTRTRDYLPRVYHTLQGAVEEHRAERPEGG